MDWPQNAIIYQIYPRSFKDSDGNGVGDIGGIIEKIPYLKELGVDAVWLSPIYKSPQKDFGYDVSDHKDIDPIFGNMELFSQLVVELHKADIKIIMDFVPNHTSDAHEWFIESKSNKTNPKRDWYIWADGKNGKEPNNWLSAFGGSAWTYDFTTNQYYYHAFCEHQPDLNWENTQVRYAMFNIMKFWLELGVDGLRVDAVDYLFEDRRLRDEPFNPNYKPGFFQYLDQQLLHVYTRNHEKSIKILKDMAGVLKQYKDKFMVTEAGITLDELIKMYQTVDWHAYQPFNFSLITLPWLSNPHKEYIDLYEKRLDSHYHPCFVIGNHDKPRVVSRVGKNQARNAAILLFTLRGNAFIYYGDEIGMRNRRIPARYATDTYDFRSPGLGLGRNGQRTPMQWNGRRFAGFSNNEPWLPVALNYEGLNVEIERGDPQSFFNLYKGLIKLKKTQQALIFGKYVPLKNPAENVYAFIRKHKNMKVLILVNFDSKRKKINLEAKGKVLINSFIDKSPGQIIDLANFVLRGDEAIVMEI